MRMILIAILLMLVGCNSSQQQHDHANHDPAYLVSLEILAQELKDPNYEWHGPTSNEDRIPVLHAARALAYRGDSSATVLFDAVDNPEIEIFSILDALSELGIPVHEFHDAILSRNSKPLREWWANHADSSLDKRNKDRRQIGLPPARIGT